VTIIRRMCSISILPVTLNFQIFALMTGRVFGIMETKADDEADASDESVTANEKYLRLLEDVARRTLLAIVTHHISVSADQMTRFTLNGAIAKRTLTVKEAKVASPFNTPSKLRTMAQTVYLLNVIHELVRTGRQVTQRELFYRSLAVGAVAPCFSDQTQLNKALLTLMDAIGCERHELGIFTTARGFVAADPYYETLCLNQQGSLVADLSAHPDGLSISDHLTTISTIQTNAACVLVVEKDTVFQSLVSTPRFFHHVPCILITARGYPDNVTIRFLNRLQLICGSSLPFLYLGDLDPHGICIFLTYYRALNTPMEWVGLHYEDIGIDYNQHSLLGLKLKPSDLSLIRSLMERDGVPLIVQDQLRKIKDRGLKYELECLHAMGESYMATEWLPFKLQSTLLPGIKTESN